MCMLHLPCLFPVPCAASFSTTTKHVNRCLVGAPLAYEVEHGAIDMCRLADNVHAYKSYGRR